MIFVALVNHSVVVAPEQCELMARAIRIQVCGEFAGQWRIPYTEVTVADPGAVPTQAWSVLIHDQEDASQLLGEHSRGNPNPIASVSVPEILIGGGSILLASHKSP